MGQLILDNEMDLLGIGLFYGACAGFLMAVVSHSIQDRIAQLKGKAC